MPCHGRWPKPSSYRAQPAENINSRVQMSRIALVERLTIGSRCGSASFLTRDSIGSGVSVTVYDSSITLRPTQTLNHGVTQTYLIVKTKRKKSLTGIAS